MNDRPWRILIAEDNPADLKMIEKSLSRHDMPCELTVFNDGGKVTNYLSKLDSNPKLSIPDLALFDVHIPNTDGRELLKAIRASSRCSGVPVIIMTSTLRPEDREDIKAFAAGRFFEKSANFESFMKIADVIRDMLPDPRR